VTLLPVDDGWVFDYGDGRTLGRTSAPHRNPVRVSSGGRCRSDCPVVRSRSPCGSLPPLDYAEPEVVCPWDDEDNCLEVGIYL
jgi:hypothetical protein